MRSIRLFVVSLLATNLILLGVEISNPRGQAGEPADAGRSTSAPVPRIQTVAEISDTPFPGLGLECFTLGPFENRQTTEAIIDLVGDRAARIGQRVTEAFVDRGYWVYLPPFGTIAEGRAALDTLLDAGLEDVRLIESGDFNKAVSLGYYFEQDNARRRRDAVGTLGFEAIMQIQRQDESRYWVDYQQQAGSEYAYRTLADVVPAGLHHRTTCPDPSLNTFTQAH